MNSKKINLLEVKKFAFKKHLGQVRPNKKREPKTVHIAEVANWVKKAGGNVFEIAAAFLHDTIEDTNTTIEEIVENFDTNIASIVNELTDPPEFIFIELEVRKQKQAERIKTYKKETKLVKIADQISNVYSVYNDPPIDWDNKKCLDYIIGAGKIIKACEGTNDFLENEFKKIYKLSCKKYQ